MRQILVNLALAAACQLAVEVHAVPNLLFILADDLGWSDTSNDRTNLGNPSDFYETPCLERLALEGMAFTNAYTNGPNCAPTRAALLTGQYAPRPTNNVFNVGDLNRGGPNTLLKGCAQGLPRSGDDAIPRHAFTFAEMLQSAGYRTAHIGKFHVAAAGGAAADIVDHHGFDVNFSGNEHGAPGAYHADGTAFSDQIGPLLDEFANPYSRPYLNRAVLPHSRDPGDAVIDALTNRPKHVTDALVDAAISFIEETRSQPFYVQIHHYAVHTPIGATHARRDLLAKYRAKPAGEEDSHASFAALVEGLDQSVARVIAFLEQTDDPRNPGQSLAENTLVVFMSDNGGRLSQSNNGPLRGQKGELYEGGIRVPLIVWSRRTGLVDGGAVNHTPVIGVDLFPTFAALAEANLPTGIVLDGEDLTPLLEDGGAELSRDSLYWHFPGYLVDQRNQRPQSVIREGAWKLLYNYEDQSFELYDLETDIGERINLAAARPDVVSRLSRRLAEWLDRTDAPLATLRSGTMRVSVTDAYYANGRRSRGDGELLVKAGDEVPFCPR